MTTPPPKLNVPLTKAVPQIEERISKGEGIKARWLDPQEDRQSLASDTATWNRINETLLHTLFDNTKYADEYAASHVRPSSSPQVALFSVASRSRSLAGQSIGSSSPAAPRANVPEEPHFVDKSLRVLREIVETMPFLKPNPEARE